MECEQINGKMKKRVLPGKGKSSMRDYSVISDEELEKLCFVEADKKYITNVIKESKKQIKEGNYKVIVSNTDIDEKRRLAL